MDVEKKALKDISVSMGILDSSCGVLSAFFGANTEHPSSNNYYKASSQKMDLFVSEELRDGMIEKIIAQKHRPAVAKKAISKRQWYTSFMDELVKNACECFALCLLL
jgi:hypothetical protein